MRFTENEIYHIYNRGNNHQTIFFSDENYLHFLKRIQFDWIPVCDMLAWCLMPNHFHFMIRANSSSVIEIPTYGGKPMQIFARKIGLTLSSYAQHINRQNKTSGMRLLSRASFEVTTNDENAQMCDARGDAISTTAGYIKREPLLHYQFVKNK